ncbi:hypothetical protein DL96DRAFT_1555859 [Flagelloscypha sp. PMI_526]|nr:hypothetical protein DL96DRAFT_1555859 [Flagelloscypha sp. PMI_526]
MPDRDTEDSSTDKKNKGSAAGSGQKSKDLSHVPCKFFKVGSCTAGSSCPFSHAAEPGAQKDVCAWFVKGNCKFAHKCALAHILPGQPMSMDRKNKKAAQLSNTGNGGERAGKDRERGKGTKRESGRADGSRGNAGGNSLLTGGSTAPTRLLARGPSVLSKANLASPSAPAPPITVKGTEFVEQFAAEEALRGQERKSKEIENDEVGSPGQKSLPVKTAQGSAPKPVQPPTTSPRSTDSHTPTHSHAPPATSPSRANGFSPGTSPSTNNPLGNGILSTSPFSVPVQSAFLSSTYGGEGLLSSRSGGPSSSLGAGKWGEETSPPRQKNFTSINAEYDATYNIHGNDRRRNGPLDDTEDGEDGAEEFVPSSLTELLTPEEMKRRMSRGNTHQTPLGAARGSEGEDSLRAGMAGMHLNAGSGGQGHRYSRSVPSPSFLGDIRNIWAEPTLSSSPSHGAIGSGLPASPGRLGFGAGYNAIPDSAGLNSAGSATSFGNHLSPSNASAAFLSSGLHQQYAQSRQSNSTGIGRGYPGQQRPSALEFSSNAPYPSPHAPQHVTQGLHSSSGEIFPTHRPALPSALSSNAAPRDHNIVGSPGARALQTHAPGQSLPQGLAAGYSRIHALPPLPTNSPSATRGLNGTPGSYISGSTPLSSSFNNSAVFPSDSFEGAPGTTPTKGGGDPLFSKISYSQMARASPGNNNASGVSPFMPPQVSRTASAARGPGNISSPLAVQGTATAGGVGGDEDLFTFSMDDMDM